MTLLWVAALLMTLWLLAWVPLLVFDVIYQLTWRRQR